MASFQVQITDGADDARAAGSWPGMGMFNNSLTSHRIGYADPYWYMVGLRFPSVPLPASGGKYQTKITSAVLRVRAPSGSYALASIWRIYAEDVDDAAAMDAGHTPYDAYLGHTDAYDGYTLNNGWWLTGEWYDLNCRSSLQEIVERPGWAEDNAVLFTVTPQASTDDGHIMETYDSAPGSAALLVVTYTVVPRRVLIMHDDPGGV